MHECKELKKDKGFLSALQLCKPPLLKRAYPLHEEEECQQLKTMLRWSLLPTSLDLQSVRNYFGWLIHVLMRDEKEGRKQQARSNKQQGKATQHTQGSHFPKKRAASNAYVYIKLKASGVAIL